MGNKVTSKITGNTVEVLRGTSRKVTLRNPVSKQIWTVARSYFRIAYIHPLWV